MNNILSLFKKYESIAENKAYKKGETIFYENDVCSKIGIVISGEISIKSYFSDGKEVIYNTLSKGQMFGNNLIFSSNPYYRGDVVCEQNAEISFLSKESLIKALRNDEDFLIEYLNEQSDFSKTLNFKIKLLTISSASDRLLYYLTFNKNKITYKSITKLAKELYLTRESLSRTIKKLKENKIIKAHSKTITLMVE